MAVFFSAPHLAMLIVVFICFAEAFDVDPSANSQMSERRKRSFTRSCPDLKMICPTKDEEFVVRTSWHGGRFFGKCKIQGSVVDIALKKCDISPNEPCKDMWKSKQNYCSAPIFRKIINYAFHPACTLHDLCYLSLNADQRDCDEWFYHNMKQICSKEKVVTRIACRSSAYLIYKTVKAAGKSYFNDAQDWADEHCS